MLRSAARRGVDWLHQTFSAKARFARRVKAAKKLRAESPHVYSDEPKLSLVLLSFNHRGNIDAIMNGLRQTVADEIIVCDDGSIDGSERAWMRHLNRPNDFLIRSNDIHEIRSYNRAIDHARGEYVAVLQDDDIPPLDGEWVRHALGLMHQYPKLAVLGCYVGMAADYGRTDKVKFKYFVGWNDLDKDWAVPFVDPVHKVPFMFVPGIGIGPVFFRREVFRELGGFDLAFSRAGEPGILLDYDLSARAWLAGYQVGVFEAPAFRRYVGGQGTMLFAKGVREKNFAANMEIVRQRYAGKADAIEGMAADLNRGLRPREDRAP